MGLGLTAVGTVMMAARFWDVNWNLVELTILPEPSLAVSLSIGAIAVFLIRRRARQSKSRKVVSS